MISQPFPNFQISQKEGVGSYDNVALNQRYSWFGLIFFLTQRCLMKTLTDLRTPSE